MTDVYFSFDTEDFTCDASSDAIRDQANILHEYGVRGNFNIAGYLARELVRNRRTDVLDALKNHCISTHTLRHSYHPTSCEFTDTAEFEGPYRRLLQEEIEGIGMVKAATGVDRMACACPPGFNYSYVGMYVYGDLDIPIYIGTFHQLPGGKGVHMCNSYQMDYFVKELEVMFYSDDYDPDAVLDELAGLEEVVLCNHPNMVLHKVFWDKANYDGANLYPMGEWVEPERHTPEEVQMYYDRLRDLLRRLQADERFVIRDVEWKAAELKKEDDARAVTKDMLPAIEKHLNERLIFMDAPSLSVADMFYAARHFLTSDEPYRPGKVHGFLEEPRGITTPVTVTAEEVRRLAAECVPAGYDPVTFLPPAFTLTDGGEIGPADLLFAMLAVAQGADTVTLTPRPQQADLSALPWIETIRFAGAWLFTKDLKDEYLGDRLRLQVWTARR